MICVKIVIAGGGHCQAAACDVGLPYRVGAPQPLLCCFGVEAVRFGELTFAVRLCQQAGVAVQKVRSGAGGCAVCGFADSSPEWVVLVAGRLPVLAGFDQAFCGVVAVGSLPGRAFFFLGVALRGVAYAGVCGCCAAEGCGAGVLGELVVCVVAPRSWLVAAAGAVAHRVVAVLLLRQAQAFEVVVGAGLGEAAELIVAVLGCP